MRILHTSDWHVGRTIRGHSRAGEHRAVLAELATLAARESVDLVLVAGDVFDSAAPAPESEQIVYRALLDLAATGAQVVLVAGNHDHPRRLDAVAPVLASAGVRAAAGVLSEERGGVAEIRTRTGETARVALLPWLSRRGIVRADELMRLEADEHEGMYATRYRMIVEHLCAGMTDDTVNLLAGHMLVTGARPGGGERSAHTVFEYAVPAAVFPATLHYAALGHLHRQQQLPARCPVWYSGSPLQLDFGEAGQDKAAVLVDAAPGVPARVTPVALRGGRGLRRLQGTLDQLEAERGAAGEDWLQIVVEGPSRAGLAEEVRAWFPNAVDVRVRPADRPPGMAPAGASARAGDPAALFGAYLAAHDVADPRLQGLFSELLDADAESDGATDAA